MMTERRVDWRGAFVVTVTPFGADGSFDEPAIRRLVEMLIGEGVDGLVLAGSTGEWYGMSDEERIALFTIAADQNRGRIKILAGTSAITTATAVKLTAAAKDIGCDGVMLLPPPYVLPTDRELLAYFAAVDEVGLPMMLYNNPGRTGVNLDAQRLQMLMELRHVAALKDSVKDLSQISATLRAHGDTLAIFAGFEAYVGPCIQRGAVGVVAMSPNVLGAEGVALLRHAMAGDWQRLVPVQERIDLLYDRLYGWRYNPYVVIKEAMRILGRPGGWPRPPLLPLPEDDREVLRRFLGEIGALPRAAAE
jgi:4-hydroxy-tetrahydrodipicolinate synthase